MPSAPSGRRRSATPSPRVRRASASPTVRQWAGAYKSPRRPARGAGRGMKALVTLLSLQSALLGKKAGGPYVGGQGKSLAVWPLGARAPYYPSTKTYNYGRVPSQSVIERVRRRPNPSRKMFPGGQVSRSLYEPELVYPSRFLKGSVYRKLGSERLAPIPRPVITASNVIKLSNAGFVFPKSVLRQAAAGQPIIEKFNMPNWAKQNKLPPALAKTLARASVKPINRVGVKKQLALPAPVKRKIEAMEKRARAATVSGIARAATAPWRYAQRARNLTSKVAALPGRAASSVKASISRARQAHAALTRAARRLPN